MAIGVRSPPFLRRRVHHPQKVLDGPRPISCMGGLLYSAVLDSIFIQCYTAQRFIGIAPNHLEVRGADCSSLKHIGYTQSHRVQRSLALCLHSFSGEGLRSSWSPFPDQQVRGAIETVGSVRAYLKGRGPPIRHVTPNTRFRDRQALFLTLTRYRMRALACLLAILAAAAVGVTSDQQVFQQHVSPGLEPPRRASDRTNSTGNLIFWSIASLLQFWPNTRYVNGMFTI